MIVENVLILNKNT